MIDLLRIFVNKKMETEKQQAKKTYCSVISLKAAAARRTSSSVFP